MADSKDERRIPALEWVSAIIGLIVAVAILGSLALQAIRETQPAPPLLDVVPVSLVEADGRYILEVKVTNGSHRTGAGVQVEGTLKQGGSDVETSTTTISYVPGDSHRRAGLVFTQDPRSGQLQLRVTGYESP